MSAEDELKNFKLQTLKRARVTAVVLGLNAVIAVLFMIYGFTQSTEAQKQRDLSEYATMVSEKCAKEKLEYKTRAEVAEMRESKEAEYARSLAEELEQLKSGKKSKK